MPDEIFQELSNNLVAHGPGGLLVSLADRLRSEKKYHDLFDVQLMQERIKLGLPAAQSALIEDLPEPSRNQLEQAYLTACREVGSALLSEKRIREAWPYLRPLVDRSAVAQELAAIEPDEDNLQSLVEILLHEGVDVERGYQLVLDHYGVCNAISAFEGTVMTRPKADRIRAAAKLVKQVHAELSANVIADIEQREGKPPASASLRELIVSRPELFEKNSYHIDTSHLASTIRFARILEDAESLSLAFDLSEYGSRLSDQFQFEGDEPFVTSYKVESLFFAALLNQRTEEALAYFKQRAEEVDAYHQGTLAAEVYVVLLSRLGRRAEAIDAAAKMIPPGTHTTGFAPSLMELCEQGGDYTRLIQACQNKGDTVGYAAAIIAQASQTPGSN